MTRSIISLKRGPAFTSPPSTLETLLAASVREAEIVREWGVAFVRSEDIASDYLLDEVREQLGLEVPGRKICRDCDENRALPASQQRD